MNIPCFGEKTTIAILGFMLLATGAVFLSLGVTVLPILGFFVAAPAFAGSYALLRIAFKEACEYYG